MNSVQAWQLIVGQSVGLSVLIGKEVGGWKDHWVLVSSSFMPASTLRVDYWSVKAASAVLGTRSRMSQDVVKNTYGTWSEGNKDTCFGSWPLYWYSSMCLCSKVSPFVSILFLH